MLKEFKEVDKYGFIKETHILDGEEDKIPENFKPVWDSSLVFYVPKWDSSSNSWVESVEVFHLLESEKDIKYQELNRSCQGYILEGFIAEVRGSRLHFSYDQEAQINFQETDRLFQNNMVDSIMWTARVIPLDGRTSGKIRIGLSKSEFEQVYLMSVKHKMNSISKLKDVLEPMVDSARTLEELSAISWNMCEVKTPLDVSEVNKLDKRIDTLKSGVNELNLANTTTMMALMQVAGSIK